MAVKDVRAAGLKGGHGLAVAAVSGEQNDGSKFIRLDFADLPADVDSGPAGHIEMYQKTIHGMRARKFHRTSGGFGFDDPVAIIAQCFDRQSSGIRIVIYNKDATVLQGTSRIVALRLNCNLSDVKFRNGARIGDCVIFNSCYDEARCDKGRKYQNEIRNS
jgi:hypothetical protein